MGSIEYIENETQSKQRFEAELEFVQCLANPHYLNFLAQQRFFQEKEFVNYLKYLQYWKEPSYAKYIMYPHCLRLLDLLQDQEFRVGLMRSDVSEYIARQQKLTWIHSKRRDAFVPDQQPPQQVAGEGQVGVVSDQVGVVSDQVGVVPGQVGVVPGQVGVVPGQVSDVPVGDGHQVFAPGQVDHAHHLHPHHPPHPPHPHHPHHPHQIDGHQIIPGQLPGQVAPPAQFGVDQVGIGQQVGVVPGQVGVLPGQVAHHGQVGVVPGQVAHHGQVGVAPGHIVGGPHGVEPPEKRRKVEENMEF